ncbi:Glycoside Hydrolase Family 5 protein [Trametes cinnabarina]|uniref:Glycoside Hydrolase Family 5 protein n=1 Tax=Pycnoporus cinnabarinus TaxID=5643 RepID=A0A060SF41_PYCCI|nr:Glycoside Hydrolase Family 5 protein [Trametes cinnabarina]
MRKFLDKVKHRLEDTAGHNGSQAAASVGPSAGSAANVGPILDQRDWYMYRKQHGVNLGSWFVLERWIADSPFNNAAGPAQSDLDVAKGQNAKVVLEHHWDTWVTDADWAWLADKGINTVRIPIGYYHICGADPGVLKGTDFADLDHVFAGAWARLTNALATAHRYGIGVLFDLHAAPGKQNGDAHSGTSLEPAFFKHARNMDHALRVLSALTTHLTAFARSHDPPLPNLVGIELLNEPQPGGHDDELKRWYADAFRALRAIDPDLPLYISDAWRTDDYAGFVKAWAQDIATPAAEHARRLRDANDGTAKTFARVTGELEGAGGALVVGEWSAALNPGSLHGAPDERTAKRAFVEAQLALYEQYCAGWFFWTYKKEARGDTGWSFRDAVEAGNSRFLEEIGFLGPWAKRRAQAHVAQKGASNVWEYEHGFKQGVRAASADLAAAG